MYADCKAPRESYVVLTKCFMPVGEAKVNQHGLSRKVSSRFTDASELELMNSTSLILSKLL
jgi:aryl-alcohol dehydrogenase-like predicted oxidoreductase